MNITKSVQKNRPTSAGSKVVEAPDLSSTGKGDANQQLVTSPHLRTSFNENGMVVLQIDRGLVYTANRTGARIWKGLAEGKSPSTIATDLNREYGVAEAQTRQHTAAFIADLYLNGLLVSVEGGRR